MPCAPRPLHVALLTLDDRAGYVIDDDLAIAELRARGAVVAAGSEGTGRAGAQLIGRLNR